MDTNLLVLVGAVYSCEEAIQDGIETEGRLAN